jgi:hypothetical protein
MRTAMLLFLAVMALSAAGCHQNMCRNCCGNGGLCGPAMSRRASAHPQYAGRPGRGQMCPNCNGLNGDCNGLNGDCNGLDGLDGRLAGRHGPSPVPHLPPGYVHQQLDGTGGPPTATYAYPYYTLRAPRDFLLNNPPPLGP